jgi:ribosomal protein S18 acetylase RimI-like enzyme
VIDLCVASAHRRRGVGRALVHAVARSAHARGATDLLWAVNRHNAEARAFYERLGATTARDLVVQHLTVRART